MCEIEFRMCVSVCACEVKAGVITICFMLLIWLCLYNCCKFADDFHLTLQTLATFALAVQNVNIL